MLILSRRQDESIIIETSDGLIEVKVCDIRDDNEGRRVKVGIEAPKHITVNRREIYEAKQREKQK